MSWRSGSEGNILCDKFQLVGATAMKEENARDSWATMTHEEKNRILYQKQKELLATFLEKGAISKGQYEKSLYDLTEKMGTIINADSVSN